MDKIALKTLSLQEFQTVTLWASHVAKNGHKWGERRRRKEINSNGNGKILSATSLLLFRTLRLSWVLWLMSSNARKSFSISTCKLLLFEIHPRDGGNLLESHLSCNLSETSCPVWHPCVHLAHAPASGEEWHPYFPEWVPTPRLLWVNMLCNFFLWLFISEVVTRIFLIRSEAMTSSCFDTCQSNTSVTWWWRTRRWSLAWSKYRGHKMSRGSVYRFVGLALVCSCHCVLAFLQRAFCTFSPCIFRQPYKTGISVPLLQILKHREMK